MHETGIVRDLVRRVVDTAAQTDAARVSEVRVWLGALSQFSPGHFREHFDEEVRGTLAEQATLEIVASQDVDDPDAQHVILQSVELDVPDAGSSAP
jgi:hydrogenase nickel incorporation protein HypA/HybF